MTRLYIVEGLPCSGKSTAAKFIADTLRKNGNEVSFFDEGTGNHPADYEFHAYIKEDELSVFSNEELKQIKELSEQTASGYIIPLSHFSDAIFEKLLQHKIYDFLPWEKEKPIMLNKWREFVKNTDKNSSYVFNCVFLQNPMCETMMRFNFSYEESLAYIKKISEIISPLEPCVIYLKNDDISEKVKQTAKEREGWLDAVIDYHTNGCYGKSINAQGFDGYIKCLEERQKRELRILSELPIKHLAVENTHRDYEKAYGRILSFINGDKND